MKRSIRVLTIIITIALLALGAAMPRLTALTLDRKLETETINREDSFSALALALETDFFKTLALFDSEHTEVTLSEGYNMTEEEALAVVRQATQRHGDAGYTFTEPEITPLLYTSKNTPELSGVFWRCEWELDVGSPEELYIDDQTGLIVSFRMRLFDGSFLSSTSDVDSAVAVYSDSPYPSAMDKLADYCRENYPVDEVNLYYDEYVHNKDAYLLTLIRVNDGVKETYVKEIYCGENYIMSF